MFGSMCLLMATNIIFFKMLLSVVSTVPSFPDVFLWMVLIVSIVKVAKKADEIITRIGLNPAITGSKSTLPGVIAYTVFRTALSMVTKGAANGIGGALGLTGKAAAGVGKSAGMGKGAAGRAFKGAGKGFGAAAGAVGGIGGTAVGAAVGGIGGTAAGPRYGGGRTQTSQTDTRQEQQSNTRQEQNRHTSQQNTSQSQTGGQRQTAGQERTSGGQRTGPGGTFRPDRPSRKTSVRTGTHRGPTYINSSGGQAKVEEKSISQSGSTPGPSAPASGFSGFHSSPTRSGSAKETAHGVGFDRTRGGGPSKDAIKDGSFSGRSHGRGFTEESAQTSGTSERSTFSSTTRSGGLGGNHSGVLGDTGIKSDTPRGSGTYGGRSSGIGQSTDFGSTFSKASQKMEVFQSGAAGTGKTSAMGKSGGGTPDSQPDIAGMGTRSTQRPPGSMPRHSRNSPAFPTVSTDGVQGSSPAQQELRQAPAHRRARN